MTLLLLLIPLTITSFANGCEGATQNIVFNILPKPMLSNGSTITICSEDTLDFQPSFDNIDSVNFTWTRQASSRNFKPTFLRF